MKRESGEIKKNEVEQKVGKICFSSDTYTKIETKSHLQNDQIILFILFYLIEFQTLPRVIY